MHDARNHKCMMCQLVAYDSKQNRQETAQNHQHAQRPPNPCHEQIHFENETSMSDIVEFAATNNRLNSFIHSYRIKNTHHKNDCHKITRRHGTLPGRLGRGPLPHSPLMGPPPDMKNVPGLLRGCHPPQRRQSFLFRSNTSVPDKRKK